MSAVADGTHPATVPTPDARPTVDDLSEWSFPASDPPQAWTWEVPPRAAPPGGPTEARVLTALEELIDPELGLDFVTLGLIYEVDVRDGDVEIVFSLTTPGCPIGPQAAQQMVALVGALEGVRSVTPRLVFAPPWSPERMSKDARFALGL